MADENSAELDVVGGSRPDKSRIAFGSPLAGPSRRNVMPKEATGTNVAVSNRVVSFVSFYFRDTRTALLGLNL